VDRGRSNLGSAWLTGGVGHVSDLGDASEVGLVVDVSAVEPPRPGQDWMIGTLASRQYGVVSTRQLLAAGIGSGAIASRVRRSRLHRLHRGVYAVGHTALVPLAREMAAVLACGGAGAAISHRSAAVLWGLVPRDDGPVDVTVARSRGRRPGLRIHRSRTLQADDVLWLQGIPTTSPERTLLDFAETAQDRELERALDEAIVQKLTTHAALVAAVRDALGRRAAPRLRALLAHSDPPALTRSEAEERLLALVRAARLEAPEVNVRVCGHLVDCLWRRRRLIVEIDGYRFHSSRSAFERDRRRDAELAAAGYQVIRMTWRRITEEPYSVVALLSQALAAAA
jgi:very-short-patch-repair endonuclease